MAINTATKYYAVLGHPVAHSLSPPMQNAAFAAAGLNAVYLAFDVPPARLPTMLDALAELGFAGLNLTVPLKEVAYAALQDFDETAARYRSVNTVQRTPTGWRGYSTDGDGFLMALTAAFGITPADRSVCVLGCGGAGRAVAIACAVAGAAELRLVNRHCAKAERLAEELQKITPQIPVRVIPADPAAWRDACSSAEVVIQATSVGLHPGDAPFLGPEAFHAGQWFYDLVYHRTETVMMRAATASGARVANGLSMLLYQGALAWQIWTGQPAPVAAMEAALRHSVYGGAN